MRGKMAFFRKTEEPKSELPQELIDLRSDIEKTKLPDHAKALALKELDRLEKTDPSVAEYAIGLNYLDYLIDLPWNTFTNDNLDIERASAILERKHHGLPHVKERVLEYLAVRTLRNQGSYSILVVDDEEMARSNIQHVLKKDGYNVKTAANGPEAIRMLEVEDFDLVITDLKMEMLDGVELVKHIKKISPGTDVVMVTGYATVDTAVRAFTTGVSNFLKKPFKLEELRQTVTEICQKRRSAQIIRGPILCFAGPPGTGKTSIGQAIAEAMERKFVRLSLAGLRDEAELRGHRRTYVGAMPGRIISEIKRLGVNNPVFMLDEIDKIGQDFRGDPASVFLEILDAEQNRNFVDHYLDVSFDLSSVMFIATANIVENLPTPLLDRLEVTYFPGYTEHEKLKIAVDYMIPNQLKDNGLSHSNISFTHEAVMRLINDYTREAGLRNLEREIANVVRKLAMLSLREGLGKTKIAIDEHWIPKLLGPRKYRHEVADSENQIGVSTGLVWTEFGGEIIFVESTIMKGSQQLILTGSLGDVLRESAQTALSHIRSHAESFGIDPDFFFDHDIHIHIPAGSIPKDGPSAGVTIAISLISLLTSRPARRDVAISGEITLSGNILPVSGIREKILAGQRAGVKVIALPESNKVDVDNLPEQISQGIEIVLVNKISKLVSLALEPEKKL